MDLISEFRDHFCQQLDNAQTGIKATIRKLMHVLQHHDYKLWHHIEAECKVDPQFYSFRWITLLLSQVGWLYVGGVEPVHVPLCACAHTGTCIFAARLVWGSTCTCFSACDQPMLGLVVFDGASGAAGAAMSPACGPILVGANVCVRLCRSFRCLTRCASGTPFCRTPTAAWTACCASAPRSSSMSRTRSCRWGRGRTRSQGCRCTLMLKLVSCVAATQCSIDGFVGWGVGVDGA